VIKKKMKTKTRWLIAGIVLAALLVTASSASADGVAKVKCYSDPDYTNEVYTFTSGDTVYAKITSDGYSSKFRWIDEAGNVVRTSECKSYRAGTSYDSYDLTGANPGTWKVERLYYNDWCSSPYGGVYYCPCGDYRGTVTTTFNVTSACTDNDGDGYDACDASGNPISGCSDPCDCNDSDNTINPGATEVCNDGIDNDCDGLTDAADPDCQGEIPEFATIAIPAVAVLGLFLFYSHRKRKEE